MNDLYSGLSLIVLPNTTGVISPGLEKREGSRYSS